MKDDSTETLDFIPVGRLASDDVAEQTRRLRASASGDERARARLIDRIDRDLRLLIDARADGADANRLLTPSALTRETYAHMIDGSQVQQREQIHFFTVAGRRMRRALVSRSTSARRDTILVPLATSPSAERPNSVSLSALDRALNDLAQFDPLKEQVVEMRFFGGLETEDITLALELSEDEVRLHWRLARAWLFRRLLGPGAQGSKLPELISGS